MASRSFRAAFDKYSVRDAYRENPAATSQLLPKRVLQGDVEEASLIVHSYGPLPDREYLRKARDILSSQPGVELYAGIEKIVKPTLITTTLQTTGSHYQIDVNVRPELTDAQILRHVGRGSSAFAKQLGLNRHYTLLEYVRSITVSLDRIARDDHLARPRGKGDIYSMWEFPPAAGAYEWNAIARTTIPASPHPVHELALLLVGDGLADAVNVNLHVKYSPCLGKK